MILTALIFIIVIGVLVFVHELGHFVMAKRAGMKVDEFGFGFPPRIWGIERGETIYSINAIPFGGFVKILGEDGDDRTDPRSFSSKPVWPRFKVLVAGVSMNFLLAVFIMTGLMMFSSVRTAITEKNINHATDVIIQVIDVEKGKPASEVSIRTLDQLAGYKGNNGQMIAFSTPEEVIKYVADSGGKEISLYLKRGNELVEKKLTPFYDEGAGRYRVGLAPIATGNVKYPWYEALWRGPYSALMLVWGTVQGFALLFKNFFLHGKLIADVSGPLGIANITGEAARVGLNYLLQFVALISVNLAVLNFLPFPALDGGRALLLGIEKIKGSPVSRKIENAVNTFGFMLLIGLMIYVTIKDIIKFI
jgi:regulator of sigma E protease